MDDPRASIAVVARTPESARRVASWLRRGVDVRLALEGDFHFGPGIQVTAVREVKGLEFDHVVIPDASTAAYPDGGEGRRALYVAVTRRAGATWCASRRTARGCARGPTRSRRAEAGRRRRGAPSIARSSRTPPGGPPA